MWNPHPDMLPPLRLTLLLLGILLTLPACQAQSNTPHATSNTPPTPNVLIHGLHHPWGMAFIDDQLLITERSGQLRIARQSEAGWQLSIPVTGLPDIDVRGQGGLLDVAVWKRWVYLSYTKAIGHKNTTAVVRGKLTGSFEAGYLLSNIEPIFEQSPAIDSRVHFGSRLIFTPDNHLFITLGDRGHTRNNAQRLDNHHGKLIRLNPDGSIPDDNPFTSTSSTPKARPHIWSYGHRNSQGAAIHPKTHRLWTHEHGPQGGDEINLPEAGRNYGWPVVTYGEEYGGGKIGTGTQADGMVQPTYYWVPSIAPSGMVFYTGTAYPDWQGNLLVGSLKFRQLVRLTLKGNAITNEERLYGPNQAHTIGERIRDIEQGPNGRLYLLTDHSNGKLWVLEP